MPDPDPPKPPRVQPRIIAAPKHGQVYWCDFWRDSQLPEFWKTRPVVIISYKNTLHGPCLVVPLSTEPQGDNPWAWKMAFSPDGRQSYAVCNHLYTVAPSRLSPLRRGAIPRLDKAEFNSILALVTAWLPRPFEMDK
jgi:mRNA interferase MazF